MRSKSEVVKHYYGHGDAKKVWDETWYKPVAYPPEHLARLKSTFPYYCPEEELPGPLPASDEVLAVKDSASIVPKTKIRCNIVVRIRDHFAVKCSTNPAILEEAENLLFLRSNSNVRVPKLYATFECPKHVGMYFLVMEYIKGTTFDPFTWSKQSQEFKMKYSTKLADQLRLLRSVPPPSPQYFGRVNFKPFWTGSLLFGTRPGPNHGPYLDYKSCIEAMHRAGEYQCAIVSHLKDFTPAQEIALSAFQDTMMQCADKSPVLTHRDLSLYNMIWTQDEEIVIIDWSDLAWLPTWLDAVSLAENHNLPGTESELYLREAYKGLGPFNHGLALFFKWFVGQMCHDYRT